MKILQSKRNRMNIPNLVSKYYYLKDLTGLYPLILKNTKDNEYKVYSDIIDKDIIEDIQNNIKIFKNVKRFRLYKQQYDNVYIIGDIHGDYKLLEHILMEIDVIVRDKKTGGYKWNPEIKNTCIIQIGDFIHGYGRLTKLDVDDYFKAEELKICNLFKDLIENETVENGNKMFVMCGNHELINIIRKFNTGKFVYATDLNTKFIKKNGRYVLNDYEREINNFIMKYTQIIVCVNNFIFTHAGINKTNMSYIFNNLQITKDTLKSISDIQKIELLNIIYLSYLQRIYSHYEYINEKIKEDDEDIIKQEKINVSNIYYNVKKECYKLIYHKFLTVFLMLEDDNFQISLLTLFNSYIKEEPKEIILKNINKVFTFLINKEIKDFDIIHLLENKELFCDIFSRIIKIYRNSLYDKSYERLEIIEYNDTSEYNNVITFETINMKFDKLQGIFRDNINNIMSHEHMINNISIINKYEGIIKPICNIREYVDIFFSQKTNTKYNLLSNYNYDVEIMTSSIKTLNLKSSSSFTAKTFFKELYEYLSLNGNVETKGMIVGHVPHDDILYLQVDGKFTGQKYIFNIDNLMSRGQNQCNVIKYIIQPNGTIIYKEPKIMHLSYVNNREVIEQLKLSDKIYREARNKLSQSIISDTAIKLDKIYL